MELGSVLCLFYTARFYKVCGVRNVGFLNQPKLPGI